MALERQRAENDAAVAGLQGRVQGLATPACPTACDDEHRLQLPARRRLPLHHLRQRRGGQELERTCATTTAPSRPRRASATTAPSPPRPSWATCRPTPAARRPALRYKALSDLTGGEVGSICDANFASTLKKLATNAVGLQAQVRAAGQAQRADPSGAAALPVQRLRRLAQGLRLERHAPPAPASRADSLNVVCTPVQGGTDGWSYEADEATSSTSPVTRCPASRRRSSCSTTRKGRAREARRATLALLVALGAGVREERPHAGQAPARAAALAAGLRQGAGADREAARDARAEPGPRRARGLQRRAGQGRRRLHAGRARPPRSPPANVENVVVVVRAAQGGGEREHPRASTPTTPTSRTSTSP